MFALATSILLVPVACIPPNSPATPFEPPHFDHPREEENPGHASVEVRMDVGWVGPGQTFHVIVVLQPDAGWHTYWKNPGSSGTPTEIEVQAPDGFVVGEPIFPRPSTFRESEGPTFGYNKQAAFFVPVTAPEVLEDGHVEFKVNTFWLACKKNCVMGTDSHKLLVSTNNLQPGPPSKDKNLIDWKTALPQAIENLEQGGVYISGNTMFISGESTLRPLRFIGIESKGVQYGSSSRPIVENNKFRLPIAIDLDFYQGSDGKLTIEGILLLGRKNNDPSYYIHFELEESYLQPQGRGVN